MPNGIPNGLAAAAVMLNLLFLFKKVEIDPCVKPLHRLTQPCHLRYVASILPAPELLYPRVAFCILCMHGVPATLGLGATCTNVKPSAAFVAEACRRQEVPGQEDHRQEAAGQEVPGEEVGSQEARGCQEVPGEEGCQEVPGEEGGQEEVGCQEVDGLQDEDRLEPSRLAPISPGVSESACPSPTAGNQIRQLRHADPLPLCLHP